MKQNIYVYTKIKYIYIENKLDFQITLSIDMSSLY